MTTTLKWTCTDADGQPLVFDVYWGTTSPPPLIASNVAAKFYYPGTQQYLTKYYWRIVAHDTKGAETTGPTWSYTTRSEDRPPAAPTNPQPADGATGQPVNVKLGWQASDPDNDVLNFDVYFGTSASPPLVANHIASMTYDPGPLAISTMYNWRIVARDPSGQETSGAVWSLPPLRRRAVRRHCRRARSLRTEVRTRARRRSWFGRRRIPTAIRFITRCSCSSTDQCLLRRDRQSVLPAWRQPRARPLLHVVRYGHGRALDRDRADVAVHGRRWATAGCV